MTTSIVLVNMDTEGRRGGRGLGGWGAISSSEHKEGTMHVYIKYYTIEESWGVLH